MAISSPYLSLRDVKRKLVVKMPKTAACKPPLKQTSQLGQKRRTITEGNREAMRLGREAKRLRIEEEKARMRLKIGVDFGNTYSGIAWIASTDEKREPAVLKEYSGGYQQSNNMEKVPTRIAYAWQNPGLKKNVWGYQVKPGMISCSLFKLLLDEDGEVKPQDDTLLQSQSRYKCELPQGKTVVDVTADYLTFVYEHILHKVETLLGPGLMRRTAFDFYFTKPAVFSLKACNHIRRAAEAAGFGSREGDTLSLLCEPEAACISAITETGARFTDNALFSIGDIVLLVDLGGGTADIVSYKILDKEPLQLEEICIGVGAKCGGTSCDRALHQLMSNKYGAAFKNLPATKTGPGSRFMEMWESIKRDFDGQDMEAEFVLELKIPLEDKGVAVDYDFETDEVTINAREMVEIFTTALKNSLSLIREQLDMIEERNKKEMTKFVIETLILCGGQGSSPYMMKEIKIFCDALGIQVIRPPRPWPSQARGAALRGLANGPITTRRSRYHYGFESTARFNEDVHEEKDAYQDPVYGKRVKDRMTWAIKKNELIKPGQHKKIPCYYMIPAGIVDFQPEIEMYMCTEDEAPSHKDPGLRKVVTFSLALSSLLKEERQQQRAADGKHESEAYTELDVNLNFKLGGEKETVEAYATAGWKHVGEATIHYEGNTAWARLRAGGSAKPRASTGDTFSVKAERGWLQLSRSRRGFYSRLR